ncbi:hypothetical protein VOLCADRAFT_106838 [Volvox carteri f. nagariensis]|uniref:Uncharacterized protein n=1 Tax=Volvox carteri f. nagariensis TaxID=3068 RepID=D8UA26_VOLCA|nr:uncharacterized protein VOLCADRAFT_106838 [Volvox carteri f. nagariensis]EFJ43353.1 hypothetical protein VOLCADRAFT_106838 [Volvox carteri f. nagariensis]|eukprot:XP_002955500.1 hypothetical protein VOLCADRAFT_106838 [Volvox carteri f. nagariensis]
MRSRVSFVVLPIFAALFLWTTAQGQNTTLGTRFDGYSYASNVIGYVNMTMDYCDIQAAITAGNFSAALGIYTTGKNSWNGLTRRTFYRFASFTPGAGVVEPLHDALAMGRNASWLDSMIKDAIAKRNGPLAAGLIQVAVLKYFFHEVDEGFTNVATYLNDTANNGILISDATGAPHNVDEAFALWAGGSPSACTTLSSWAAQLGADLETTFVGRSYINSAMTLALNELQAAARKGNAVSYNDTRAMVQRYITLLGLQGVMRSVYRAEVAVACKRPAAQIAEAQAFIAVHLTYLEPMLLASNVRPALVQDLNRALTNSTPSYSRALPAIRVVVSALGRRMAEVGEPRFEVITAGWTNCKLNSPPVVGRRLL